MEFKRRIVQASDEHRLASVLFELTYRCNLDCFFCYNDLGLRGSPVATERYFELFEELAGMQVFELTLSGGEPLLHPDFFAIGRRARDLGFVVRIKSNGHVLSGKLIDRLQSEVDPFIVDVSLHGGDAETHDRQTRVEGSFDRLLLNLAEARDRKLRLKLNATVTRWNEHQIAEMFAVAESIGLPISLTSTVTPKDDGDTSPLSIAPSMEAVRELARIQMSLAAGQPRGEAAVESVPAKTNCSTGASTLAIDPYGNVFPCVQWRRSLGNVHEQSIGEIWSGSPALTEVRRLNEEAKKMVDGLEGPARYMSHCLGLAEMSTGDPLGIDPAKMREVETLAEARQQRNLLPVIG